MEPPPGSGGPVPMNVQSPWCWTQESAAHYQRWRRIPAGRCFCGQVEPYGRILLAITQKWTPLLRRGGANSNSYSFAGAARRLGDIAVDVRPWPACGPNSLPFDLRPLSMSRPPPGTYGRGERKLVTVIFADISGFTELSERATLNTFEP